MSYFDMKARIEMLPAQSGPDGLAHVALHSEACVESLLVPLFPVLTALATNRSAFGMEQVPRPFV